MEFKFTPRNELSNYEWDTQKQKWHRIELDRQTLNELSQRSNFHGLMRVFLLTLVLVALAAGTMRAFQYHWLLAVPVLYAYYFFYGFWVALAHELQHRIVFAPSMTWFSEIVYYIVQTLIWNSPRYARISHQLHHRYTMVRGVDPETAWPEVITSQWLRRYLGKMILNMLVVGAVYDLFKAALQQIHRAMGKKDRMMTDHCTDKDIRAIRLESLMILLVHLVIAVGAVWLSRWELLVFITLAWQIGSAIENLWHATEHIGLPYNVNDPRFCTRSVRVGTLVHLIFGGLDDHVDHHLYPGVPSRNLPKLHRVLQSHLAEPKSMIACWQEMFDIAREKDRNPQLEYVPIVT